jgi:oligoendopeptidase F
MITPEQEDFMNRRHLALLAVPLLLAATHLTVRGTERSEIDNAYKWKPEHIYASLQAWQSDLDSLKADIDKLAAYKGRFAGPNATDPARALIEFNALSKDADIKFDHVDNYVQYHFHVDMGNNEWSGREQIVRNLMVDYSQKLAWHDPELLLIPQETMMKYVSAHPELGPYRKIYEDMYALQKHTLSTPEEELLALSGNITGTPADVYGKFTDVDMEFGTIKDEKGDTVRCDYSGWVSYRTNKDRRVREDYFKAVWNGYKHYETTLAALMAGNIKKDIYLTKARKFDNTLQRALDNTFIPEAVYTNLVNTTRANTAPVHKYDQIRKRLLGVDHYRHWDYYVNLVPGDESRYTWDQGVAMIEDALKPMGKEYLSDLAHGLDTKNGWVDVYASQGKRGGAYSSSTYGIHPYMLFNFDYKKGLTLDDVSTMAHEVGHSMHTWYSEKAQPFPTRDYVIFNAEVASTTNETLMAMKLLDDARKAYKKASGKDKEAAKQRLIYLLEQNINSGRDTYYRQVMFATWEWEAHKMGERGEPLTAESFDKLYGDLLKEWHGPAAEYEDLSSVSWATIPHFYRAYYVYSYATSYAAAVALAKDIRAEAAGDPKKKGAHERYINYLKSGSSKHPVELLKDAGVDMTTPAPIEAFVSYFSSLVDELDALTK